MTCRSATSRRRGGTAGCHAPSPRTYRGRPMIARAGTGRLVRALHNAMPRLRRGRTDGRATRQTGQSTHQPPCLIIAGRGSRGMGRADARGGARIAVRPPVINKLASGHAGVKALNEEYS